MTTIFIAESTNARKKERIPAQRAFDELQADGRWDVIRHPCSGPFDYADGLMAVWGLPGDLIIVEHDLAPTVADVERLELCLHPRCAGTYWMSSITTGYRVAKTSALNTQPRQDFVEPGCKFADMTGIGFVRIHPEQRRTPIKRVVWGDVCGEVNRVVGGPWHLHWPTIKHYHGMMELVNV
jgi:hypothetical protein